MQMRIRRPQSTPIVAKSVEAAVPHLSWRFLPASPAPAAWRESRSRGGGERHARQGDQRRVRAEQRAACAAQASESKSSSMERKPSRRSCGGERHT